MSLRDLISAVVVVFCVLAMVCPACAEILVNEQFSYEDGLLVPNPGAPDDPSDDVGQTPVPGPGAPWVAHADGGNTPIQVINEAAVLVQGSGTGGREDVNVGFPPQSITATTYARIDFMLPSGQTVNPDLHGMMFAHLKSDRATNHFRANTGVVVPTGGGDFGLALNANGIKLDEGTTWPVDLYFDTIYRVVTNWNAETGEAKLWLNPTDESSAFISHTGHSKLQSMEAFALRQSSDYFGTQIIDNIVVATSFAEAFSGVNSVGLLGDYNGNDQIDAADYSAWRDTFEAAGTELLNDPTPGVVDESDFEYWRAHFGEFANSGASSSRGAATVPEPSGALLAVLGIVVLRGAGRALPAASSSLLGPKTSQ